MPPTNFAMIIQASGPVHHDLVERVRCICGLVKVPADIQDSFPHGGKGVSDVLESTYFLSRFRAAINLLVCLIVVSRLVGGLGESLFLFGKMLDILCDSLNSILHVALGLGQRYRGDGF